MLALVVLDTVASQGRSDHERGDGDGVDEGEGGYDAMPDEDGSGGRGGFYVGSAGGQPVVLELRVDLRTQACSGEGATPAGGFGVAVGSGWTSGGGGGERLTLLVAPPPPGQGQPGPASTTLQLSWGPLPGDRGGSALTSAGVALKRVGRAAALRARRLVECKGLAQQLWRAVVEHDQGGPNGPLGKWPPLQQLADRGSRSGPGRGGDELDRGFSGTLLWAVASAHGAALAAAEFRAPWLALRWQGDAAAAAAKGQGAGAAADDAAWLGASVCVEDLGLCSGDNGAPALPLLKKCLDSAARGE
jgi:hypothetical protein